MSTGETAMPTPFLRVSRSLEADWDPVYRELLPRIYNYFRYRVGPGPEAEDLTSETFVRAWQARERYRGDLGAFSTWLYTIAERLAIDHFRSRKDYAPLELAEHIPAGLTPEDLAAQQSDALRLAHLLAGMPERDREVLALKYGADLSNREIARLRGLTESNVGTILHRSILALRAKWFAEAEWKETSDER
jgi:RNA polymerase sigma-70 factor (ECF subfamily)